MNKLLGTILLVVSSYAFIYLLAAFIMVDFDFRNWSEIARVLYIAITSIILIGILGTRYNDKFNK